MESTKQEIDLIDLTAQFVNSTSSHIFLTGKAGTGKTTFLRNLAQKTHKNYVIVAPTGIAALNAQGVTIHSQFLFPFGSFVPENKPDGNFGQSARFYTQRTLASKHPINSVRKQVLRTADLLIIDEVSMLRADILDAIDYRMKSVKGNFGQSFGGVQVLFIGDLLQLPPIVKDEEWYVLKSYYRSMHFFEALALKEDPPIYIELEKIFRQQDDKFIQILNNLRDNRPTKEDIEELNLHYKTEADLQNIEGVITLTTHNRKAESINQKQLAELDGKTYYYTADIDGEFPESIFPSDETIGLKIGAQIMFIRNDTSLDKRYFNGKLAKVTTLTSDRIKVILDGEKNEYTLHKDLWENKKYIVNPDSKELEEEVVGSFEQYPIKLAWAVTVHKSQGLTFEKAIVDVGQAFAPGQIYVALSRLRSLDGLMLRTKISTNSLNIDRDVSSYVEGQHKMERLPILLEAYQSEYLRQILALTFDFSPIEKQLDFIVGDKKSNLEFELEEMQQAIPNIREKLLNEKNYTIKFKNQLLYLLGQNDHNTLEERLKKGTEYYLEKLIDLQKSLLNHVAEVEQFSKTKTYLNTLGELDQLFTKSISEIRKSNYIVGCILKGIAIEKIGVSKNTSPFDRMAFLENSRLKAKDNSALKLTKTGKRKKKSETNQLAKPKVEKGETYKITYALIKDGMSLKEIAATREMAISTIEGHAIKGLQANELIISQVLPPDTIEVLTLSFKKSKKGVKEIVEAFKGKYSYNEVRMVQASLIR
ncbi:MAG: helix-turn-helix domain-containing protein [Flavobacteriales bacterium]|nr:helix-turn-helix domain-containing protein [Flavobacteriales bacterium]